MNGKSTKLTSCRTTLMPALFLAAAALSLFSGGRLAEARRHADDLVVTADFVDREIKPTDKIELKLSREVGVGEGRVAIVAGGTDLTAFFSLEGQTLSYTPRLLPLPIGGSTLLVYLVTADGDWKSIAEFPLKVKAAPIEQSVPVGSEPAPASNDSNGTGPPPERAGDWDFEFTPNLTVNTKGQNQAVIFPRESAPARNPATDVDGQASLQFKISRRGWTLTNKYDLVGVSFLQNALRFGELQQEAPKIDLSSYLIEFGKGRFAVRLGHVSFGSNRHLINSFSSRGITVTLPVGKQNEISLAAMNGTSVVGFDNFLGISRRKHSVVSATFAREFFKERPGGLRLEASVMRGSLLPLSNFNQREVNDAERSLGFGFRVLGSDTKQRLRYEAGFSRSRFVNPQDPQLEQGFTVTPIQPTTRNARYGEISFDFIQGMKLWKEKKLKVTGTYRHEEIEPLFRSIVASTQADRRQNQFEVTASFGEINFTYGNLRDRDNLSELPSILKTINRRNNVIFSIALNSFFTPTKPIKWLPQVSYSYDHVHQFGAFFPLDGEFRDASQIPDQDSFLQSVNAQWQLSSKISVGYRYNRSFQDNKQPGRDLADFESAVSAVTLGLQPHPTLNLGFDVSRDGLRNFEQPRIDRTFRIGTTATWQVPFLKNLTWNQNFSTTLAGDAGNTNDNRNIEFDTQLAYKFTFGKEKFRKFEAQFFVRYANRYGEAFERVFFVNNFTRSQTFNAGITFNFF